MDSMSREVVAWPPTLSSDGFGQNSGGNRARRGALDRLPEDSGPGRPPRPNHILLLTIRQVRYPITTGVLSRICEGLAKVVRIVVIKKREVDTVQALMEFANVETAMRVRNHLDGADIYDSCCRISVDFAFERVYKLKVTRNCEDSWDFTCPDLNSNKYKSEDRIKRRLFEMASPLLAPPTKARRLLEQQTPAAMPLMMMGPPPFQGPILCKLLKMAGGVCIVYDLVTDLMTPKRLFNLFCLYGDVLRIKFLASKPGSAMVEMGPDGPAAVDRVVKHLNGVVAFGQSMTVRRSHQTRLIVGKKGGNVDDAKTVDFTCGDQDDLFRFLTPTRAAKNRIVAPGTVVHFFNLPLDRGNDLAEILQTSGAPRPIEVKVFPQSATARSLSGLAEFDSIGSAVDTVALCNHIAVESPTVRPHRSHVLKLCFSVNTKFS